MATKKEKTKFFIESWNNFDILISSMDIEGDNAIVLDRDVIQEHDLKQVVCRIKDSTSKEKGLTAKQLIKYYLDDELRVFQEVPYI